jgi:hypothetical protein
MIFKSSQQYPAIMSGQTWLRYSESMDKWLQVGDVLLPGLMTHTANLHVFPLGFIIFVNQNVQMEVSNPLLSLNLGGLP